MDKILKWFSLSQKGITITNLFDSPQTSWHQDQILDKDYHSQNNHQLVKSCKQWNSRERACSNQPLLWWELDGSLIGWLWPIRDKKLKRSSSLVILNHTSYFTVNFGFSTLSLALIILSFKLQHHYSSDFHIEFIVLHLKNQFTYWTIMW